MASSEKVVPMLPDTLPDDFGEWDKDAAPPPAPGSADEWDSVIGRSEPPRQKAHGEPENLDQILSNFADRSRVWRSDSHAPVIARPQNEFAGLEREISPAPLPRKSSEPPVKEAASIGTSRPVEPPSESKMVFSPKLDNPTDDWPALSEPVFASKAEKSSAELIADMPSTVSTQPEAKHTLDEAPPAPSSPNFFSNEARKPHEVTDSMAREADRALFQVFSAKSSEEDEEPSTGKNKKLIVVGGAAAAVLIPLILILSLGHHGAKAAENPSARPVSSATDTQPETSTPDQSAREPLPQDKPSAATKNQQATASLAAQTGTQANPSPAASQSQIQMMKDQLNAPKIISGGVKKEVAENAPPPDSIGMASMDALEGARPAANAFNTGAKPVVRSLKPVAISSGVATGMLIQKTPPVYPTIAKTARVAGTVELSATISKTGTTKEVHVVSGPVMLRQAAIDAVRTWRYKPYMLNNEPVEVETSINVVFNLAN